jgi:alkanesulfonate monooxygenase SsuD/methylene tetrahydromethanopterin reductase-like flavin-dependent oxidoreductase (luciferase family)
MREYVTALRDLLAGRSVTVDGRYVRLIDVRLDWPPQQRVPVLIGGTGPKTLAMAGQLSDGVVLDSQYTVTTLREALNHVASARHDRGETPFSTVMFLACGADQVAASAGPYLDAGVDTLVFQPDGPQSVMPELITAVGGVAAKRQR